MSSLESLDLSNIHTDNVVDLSHMFYNCSSLTSLNLTNFNTNKATYKSYVLWLLFFNFY